MESYENGDSRYYIYRELHLPSVTTILDCVKHAALVNWQHKMIAEKAIELAPHLQTFIEMGSAMNVLMGVPDAMRDQRGRLGTQVHKAIEDYISGETPVISDEIRPYFNQFKKFVHEWQPEFEYLECAVANTTVGYAGRFDMLATIGERRVILDWKSNKRGPSDSAALQINAYAHAEIMEIEAGEIVEMPHIDAGLVVHLAPWGYKPYLVEVNDAEFEDFLAVVRIFKRENRTERPLKIVSKEQWSAVGTGDPTEAGAA